jgi:hypothetical protein
LPSEKDDNVVISVEVLENEAMNLYNDDELKEKRKRLEDFSLPPLQAETLMEIFDFDSLTLDMNRRNFVTKSQRDMITAALKGEADSMWLMITIAMSTSVILALIFALQGLPTLYLVIGLAVFILPMLWYAYAHQGGLRKDMERLRALRIDGIPSVQMANRSSLNIGNQSLPITIAQAKALSEFQLPFMRLYYAEHSKQILSAELVYDEKLKMEDLDENDIIEAKRQYEEE